MGNSDVTFLNQAAVTWVWGSNAKFQGEAGADWFGDTFLKNSSMFFRSGGVQPEICAGFLINPTFH